MAVPVPYSANSAANTAVNQIERRRYTEALRNAHNAGDTQAAQRLAKAIRRLENEASPPIEMSPVATSQETEAGVRSTFKPAPSAREKRQLSAIGAVTPGTGIDSETLEPTSYRNPVDQDARTTVATSPLRVARGLGKGFEASGNLGRELVAQGTGFDPRLFVSDEEGFHLYKNVGKDGPRPFSFAEMIPKGADSVGGELTEGVSQFIGPRVAFGKAAPGGGFFSQIGKDALAVGAGYEGDQGRVADMIAQASDEGKLSNGLSWLDNPYTRFLSTQEGDNDLVGRAKNTVEDLTISGPLGAPILAYRAAQAARRAGQSAPSPSSGGGANTTPAPTLQASPAPASVPANAQQLARSDAKIIARLLRAGGVPRNDVMPILRGMFDAYQGVNDPRMRLAGFAEEYLPQHLPKQVASDVVQQLRGFGYERLSSGGPGDASRAVMLDAQGTLKGSQKAYLTGEIEGALGKTDLFTTKGKIARDKSNTAEAVYRRALTEQDQAFAAGKATPEQEAARDALLTRMGEDQFFKLIPDEIKLKAQNEGLGLWERAHQRPIETAHWLQSELGRLSAKGNDPRAGEYHQMRMMLLRPLEDAVTGYRGARKQYGDLFRQEAAVSFADDMQRVARSSLGVREKAAEFKRFSKPQQAVALRAIKEKILDTFRQARAATTEIIDPATNLPIPAENVAITQLQKEGFLDALNTILPPAKAKRITDAIQKVMKENDRLASYGSDTHMNFARARDAGDAVKSPVNRAIGDVTNKRSLMYTVPMDAMLASQGLPPVLTAAKVGGDIVSRFGNPSPKKLASATETLFGTPPPAARQNGLNPQTARTSVPRTPPKGKALPATPENLADLRRQLDAIDSSGKARTAADNAKARGLIQRINNMQKKLDEQGAGVPATRNSMLGNGLNIGAPIVAGGLGWANPQDWNEDGEITPDERLKTSIFSSMGTGALMQAGKPLLNGLRAQTGGDMLGPIRRMVSPTERAIHDMRPPSQRSFKDLPPKLQTELMMGEEVARARAQGIPDEQIARALGLPDARIGEFRNASEELDRFEELLGAYDWGNPAIREGFYGPNDLTQAQRASLRQQQAQRRGTTVEDKRADYSQRQDPEAPRPPSGDVVPFNRPPDANGLWDSGGSKPPSRPLQGGAQSFERQATHTVPTKTGDVEVRSDIFSDTNGHLVFSPDWPSNVGADAASALRNRADEFRPRLVDDRFGQNKPTQSASWASENPDGASALVEQVADEFVKLVRGTPQQKTHMLALSDEFDNRALLRRVQEQLPRTKALHVGRDGGEIAVVDSQFNQEFLRQFDQRTPRRPKKWESAGYGRATDSSTPAQNGMGGKGGKLPNGLSPVATTLGQGIAGGLLGAAVGGVVDPAEAQTAVDPAEIRAVGERISALESEMIPQLESDRRMLDEGSPEEVQAILDRRGFDLGPHGRDGKIGPDTKLAIADNKAQIDQELKTYRAELEIARKRREDLEQQAAYAATAPGPIHQAVRQYAPAAGFLAGALGGKGLRSLAVRNAAKKAAVLADEANALLTPGKVTDSARGDKGLNVRAGKINDFWRMGGAGDNVPFIEKATGAGEWKRRPKPAEPSSLFPPGPSRWRSGDTAVTGLGLGEGAAAHFVGLPIAEAELEEAQIAVDNDPSEANLARLQSAKDKVAFINWMSLLGPGVAAGRVGGAFMSPYKHIPPKIGAAETERALLNQAIKTQKK